MPATTVTTLGGILPEGSAECEQAGGAGGGGPGQGQAGPGQALHTPQPKVQDCPVWSSLVDISASVLGMVSQN